MTNGSLASLAFTAILGFLIPLQAQAKVEVFYCVEEKNIKFDKYGEDEERPLRKFTVKFSSGEGNPAGNLYTTERYEHFAEIKGWSSDNRSVIFWLNDYRNWVSVDLMNILGFSGYGDSASLRLSFKTLTYMWNDINYQIYIRARCEKF